MRLGHLPGQILPIVQNAPAASTVTPGFCLFSQVSLPGSEKLDPGIPESSREFPLPGIPIVAPCSTILQAAHFHRIKGAGQLPFEETQTAGDLKYSALRFAGPSDAYSAGSSSIPRGRSATARP